MRLALLVASSLIALSLVSGVALVIGVASAQTTPPPTKDAPNTTGRTTIPEKKEQGQPRRDADPANTPAAATPSRRQGETAAPDSPAKK